MTANVRFCVSHKNKERKTQKKTKILNFLLLQHFDFKMYKVDEILFLT